MNKVWSVFRWQRSSLFILGCCAASASFAASDLINDFVNPPDSARPGVYWYFMDGNISREGMTRDLEAMKKAGLGHALFLEVNLGMPRGPVTYMSEQWQELYAHAVHEADRLGIQIMLGTGPGWCGAGGPWVKAEDAMQHLVASRTDVAGPGPFMQKLPVPPPYKPHYDKSFFRDVCVLAFPTPSKAEEIPDLNEKAMYERAPFSGAHQRPYFEMPEDYPATADSAAIPMDKVIDLTSKLQQDGSLDWQIPAGNWTVMRFVSRNNGSMTNPAPQPGLGFECDKWNPATLDEHLKNYAVKLLQKVGPQQAGRGWTFMHSDSWEMGAQNWTPKFREEFQKRRGYDPQPFYPCYSGLIVDSREKTERFLWDLRQTGNELIVEYNAEALKAFSHKNGMLLSIEPYDMHPGNDFDLGAVADMPMCEFWYKGFDTAYAVEEAASIAHVMGRSVLGAESFTSTDDWQAYPANVKNEGDWAFSLGVNRFTYHTFAHKPDETRPGMQMAIYGVHWDRGQTWWPMADAYHCYISRCSEMLRQGCWVADVLYLMPEGAPNVFQPPLSASDKTGGYPERKGYNYDGCSASALMKLAGVRNGSIVFPGGASYRLLVLPNRPTMTPELLAKLESFIKEGATVVGPAPRKSPSLVNFPTCDDEVAAKAKTVWGTLDAPAVRTARAYGKGRVIWGGLLNGKASKDLSIAAAQWIWYPEGEPAQSAPAGAVFFRRDIAIDGNQKLFSARLEATADNSFIAFVNGVSIGKGDNLGALFGFDIAPQLKAGVNRIAIRAENGENGNNPNPAGFVCAVELKYADGSGEVISSDDHWGVSRTESAGWLTAAATGGTWKNSKVLGPAGMGPWNMRTSDASDFYAPYDLTASILKGAGVPEDFTASDPVRYAHRSTKDSEIYFVSNRSEKTVQTDCVFRVAGRLPELWHPQTGEIRSLPEFKAEKNTTAVPLRFEPYESYFVIFPKTPSAEASKARSNFTDTVSIAVLEGAWDVAFDPAMGGPAQIRFEKLEDWTQRPEEGIKYYSGIATYRKAFDLPNAESLKSPVFLDLGVVQAMARVRLNGQDCGVAWTAPWRVDISKTLKPTGNALEIEVANLWPNRMLGDAKHPDQKPYAQTTHHPYAVGQPRASDPLITSGLLGPVVVKTTRVGE
jgi:hypothetical protein